MHDLRPACQLLCSQTVGCTPHHRRPAIGHRIHRPLHALRTPTDIAARHAAKIYCTCAAAGVSNRNEWAHGLMASKYAQLICFSTNDLADVVSTIDCSFHHLSSNFFRFFFDDTTKYKSVYFTPVRFFDACLPFSLSRPLPGTNCSRETPPIGWPPSCTGLGLDRHLYASRRSRRAQ